MTHEYHAEQAARHGMLAQMLMGETTFKVYRWKRVFAGKFDWTEVVWDGRSMWDDAAHAWQAAEAHAQINNAKVADYAVIRAAISYTEVPQPITSMYDRIRGVMNE